MMACLKSQTAGSRASARVSGKCLGLGQLRGVSGECHGLGQEPWFQASATVLGKCLGLRQLRGSWASAWVLGKCLGLGQVHGSRARATRFIVWELAVLPLTWWSRSLATSESVFRRGGG